MKRYAILLFALALLVCANANADTACAHDGACTYLNENGHACAKCGQTLPHQITPRFVAPTCSSVGYTMDVCAKCSYEGAQYDVVPKSPTAHSYGGWTTTLAPTCSQEGRRERACALCGAKQTEALAKTAHAMTAVVHAPDCLRDGYTQHLCGVCGAAGEKTDIVYHSAAYHVWSEFTVLVPPACETEGEQERVCSACGAKHRQSIPAKGHTPSAATIEAGCETDGYMVMVCQTCGKETGEKTNVSPAAHTFTEWQTSVEPGCETNGEATRICGVCGKTETAAIDPTGHTLKEGVKKPTCASDGYTIMACTVCGREVGEAYNVIPASEEYHVWEEWEELLPATCTSRGEWLNRCQICGEERDVTSPMLDHEPEPRVVPATFTSDGYATSYCKVCDNEVGWRRDIVPAGMYGCEMSLSAVENVPVAGISKAELRTAVSGDGTRAGLLLLSADENGGMDFDANDAWFAENHVAYVELIASDLRVRVAANGTVSVRVGGAETDEGYELISVLTTLSNAGFDESLGEYDREGAYVAQNESGEPLTLYGRELVITMPSRQSVALIATVEGER